MKIKKTWKLIIILLIVPLLLFGVLLVYLQSNQSDIIQKEIAKLNQSYDGLISVGESQLAIFENFPYISIKVEGVHIYESKKDNSPEILNVKDIYVGFNLFDILQGNYDIQSLLIEDGDFNIVLLKNQTTNIQNSLTNAAETTTSTSSSCVICSVDPSAVPTA